MTFAFSAAWSLLWKSTALAALVELGRRGQLRGTRAIPTLLFLIAALLAASSALPVARVPLPGLVLLSPSRWLLVAGAGVAAAGALVLLGRLAADLRRLRLLTCAGERVTAGLWREALDRIDSRNTAGRSIPIVAARIDVPLTWGWRHPVIVIPEALAIGAPLPGVLRHELEHVARRDWPKLVAFRVVAALLFWLPATWILLRWFEAECESSCDAAVVDGGIARDAYGHEILACARRGDAFAGAPPLAGRRSLLARRLFVILGHVPNGRPPRLATVALLLFVSFVLAPLRFGAPALVVPSPAPGESPRDAAVRLLNDLDDPSLHEITTAIDLRDFSRRRSGPGTLDCPAALGPLALATFDANPDVRRTAVWALGEMRYPTSLPVLLPRLDDASPAVRAEACWALADVPLVPVTTPLVLRLADSEAIVRRAAAHALGDRRDPAARGALEARLNDRDSSVRAEARWALDQL